jgi:DNA-binding NarL/FixJ family response regulator
LIRVLIADDHPLARAGLGQLLGSLDDITLVGAAQGGREAVELAAEHEPDVVLMDLEMPDMDGIETTHVLRERHPATAVVVLTSFADRERILAALDAGAVGYLLKDVQPDELARAIQAAAAGQSPLHPRAAQELLADRRSLGPTLTEREEEVLALVARGRTNAEIATELFVGLSTVKTHVASLMTKLGARNRVEIAMWAYDTRRVRAD